LLVVDQVVTLTEVQELHLMEVRVVVEQLLLVVLVVLLVLVLLHQRVVQVKQLGVTHQDVFLGQVEIRPLVEVVWQFRLVHLVNLMPASSVDYMEVVVLALAPLMVVALQTVALGQPALSLWRRGSNDKR